MNEFLAVVFFIIGCILISNALFTMRYIWAYNKACRYIQSRGIDSGILVRHGMVTDKRTGEVIGTTTPSDYCIQIFFKGGTP